MAGSAARCGGRAACCAASPGSPSCPAGCCSAGAASSSAARATPRRRQGLRRRRPRMDDLDRRIVTALQRGIAVVPRPFAAAARDLGIDEATLILKLKNLLAQGALTRFGPLFNADRLGGAFTLCAMSVPARDFERVCGIVNAFREVAHNYEREHRLNMWFVLATPA